MEHYRYFQNTACEYFPCHAGADKENFNCLFCYCPLYALAEHCGGHFRYTADGIKDCSGCSIPHRPENYEKILSKMDRIMEIAKRKGTNPEKP